LHRLEHHRSLSIASFESSSLGRKPRAPLSGTSGSSSARSWLEIRSHHGAVIEGEQPLGDLEAVDVRQVDVHERELRPQGPRSGEGGGAVDGLPENPVALAFEQPSCTSSERRMVVYYEDGLSHLA
jgi:hypothetical protein